MKHNVRKKEYGWNCKEYTVIEEIDCEYGSGILDKNGKEIFEGDKVIDIGDSDAILDVRFNGAFELVNSENGSYYYDLDDFDSGTFELVDDPRRNCDVEKT